MTYSQAERPMTVTTPLGPDELLLVGFTGHESISQLFNFQLELVAENGKNISFDQLLGQSVTISLALPEGGMRYFNGICSRFSQGAQDPIFTHYRMEVVPFFWVFTRRSQSRIFQQKTVPDILREVLAGMQVTFEIQGTFHPRDYSVQYRETDFNFACRTMEEEGIYYFFKHTAESHTMVLANTPQSHPDIPVGPATIIYEGVIGGNREANRIYYWDKTQELRSGKYTLWDYCFELPYKHLEAEQPIMESVSAGTVTHKLKVGGNDKMEIYDWPGEYAQRFDGIDRGGGEQPSELQKIFEDNRRTVGIRMQQEALPSLVIQGSSDVRHLVSGHKFALDRHFNANGPYVLTGIHHSAQLSGDYRSAQDLEFSYDNSFTCIPHALPFRPLRTTPKPAIHGTQAAVVVGPAGEEIFTDKYGRVKVQFYWDRLGRMDADSSCWIRVGSTWAGRLWGAIHIPRIGQEVIVAFEEGDPDQPIILGSVYNADDMPPFNLPDMKTISGIKSNSSMGGGGYNEIIFQDKKGEEKIIIHAQQDYHQRAKSSSYRSIGAKDHLIVGDDQLTEIKGDEHRKVVGDQMEKVEGTISREAGLDLQEKVGMNYAMDAGMEVHLKAGLTVVVEAGTSLTLKVGGNFINLNPAGVFISGSMVMINSGGSAGSGSGSSPQPPDPPVAAAVTRAGERGSPKAAPAQAMPPPQQPTSQGTQARALEQAAESGRPFCEVCEEARRQQASQGGGAGGGEGAGSGGG